MHKLFSNRQHGFVKGKLCLTNLLESFETWTKALDEGYGLDIIIYLDYRKAFDMVPHQRLLHKLRLHGVTPKYVAWIENYLSNRK